MDEEEKVLIVVLEENMDSVDNITEILIGHLSGLRLFVYDHCLVPLYPTPLSYQDRVYLCDRSWRDSISVWVVPPT